MVTAILYWRRPDAFYNPQLWAEDGNIFFTDAFFTGARSFSMPFGGYYHTLARAAALIGSWIPVRYVPHWYVFASWLLLVLVVGYIFSARFPFGRGQKFLLGLALVGTTANGEVFFNLANWAAISGLIWLLLAMSNEPWSRRQSTFDGVLLVMAGLSSPFVVCFWLAFLMRWWVRRTTHSYRLLLLSLLVALIQVWHMPARMTDSVLPTISLLFLDGLIYRFGFMFIGESVFDLRHTPFLRLCGLVAVFGFYGTQLVTAVARTNWPQLTALGGGILAAILKLYVERHHPEIIGYHAGRHFYIPAVTLAWALILSARPWKWLPLTMILAAFLFLTPSNKNQILPDLDWAGHTARCVGTQSVCRIPVNPVRDPPVFFAIMKPRVFAEPPIQTEFASSFGGMIELLGYDVAQSRSEIRVRFVWRAMERMNTDLMFFVHLFNPDTPTEIASQADVMPLDWQYPTSLWVDREIVVDQVALSLDTLPQGEYGLAVGWYNANASAMPRLVAYDSQGQVWKDNRVILPLTVAVP
jgi:hypothetical protein